MIVPRTLVILLAQILASSLGRHRAIHMEICLYKNRLRCAVPNYFTSYLDRIDPKNLHKSFFLCRNFLSFWQPKKQLKKAQTQTTHLTVTQTLIHQVLMTHRTQTPRTQTLTLRPHLHPLLMIQILPTMNLQVRAYPQLLDESTPCKASNLNIRLLLKWQCQDLNWVVI